MKRAVITSSGQGGPIVALTVVLGLACAVLTGCDSKAELLVEEGERLYDNEQFDEALAKFRAAAVEDPKYSKPYKKIAGVYKKRGDYVNALLNYEKAIEIDPEDVKIYEKIAGAHINKYVDAGNDPRSPRDPSDLDKAVQVAKKALEDRLVMRNPELADKLEDHMRRAEKLKADHGKPAPKPAPKKKPGAKGKRAPDASKKPEGTAQ